MFFSNVGPHKSRLNNYFTACEMASRNGNVEESNKAEVGRSLDVCQNAAVTCHRFAAIYTTSWQ